MIDEQALYNFFKTKIAVRFNQTERGLKQSFRNWKKYVIKKQGEVDLEQVMQQITREEAA